jgi:hypothetical protein
MIIPAVVLFLGFIVRGTLIAQDTSLVESSREDARIEATKLDSLYKKCIAYPDSLPFKLAFFEKFPSNFEKLNLIYGFPNNEPGILYNHSEEHVSLLFNKLDCCILEGKYYNKLIKIGIGGKWAGDAVSTIQEKIREKILKKPLLIIRDFSKSQNPRGRKFLLFFL